MERVTETSEGDRLGKWVKNHAELYSQATRHPFIISIRDGSFDVTSFKNWLGQDYYFVKEFILFVELVMRKASSHSTNSGAMDVIRGGLTALHDEIIWFRAEAEKWGFTLPDVIVHPSNLSYCRFLEGLKAPEVGYCVVIVAFWAIEIVYQESFSHCLEEGNKTASELIDVCKRWGSKEFGEYCGALKDLANRALEGASCDVQELAEATFVRVLRHEVEFWDMSIGVV